LVPGPGAIRSKAALASRCPSPGHQESPGDSASYENRERGSMESQWSFCHLRPEGPIAGGAVLGEGQIAPSPPESEFGGALSRVQGGALATQ